MNSAEEMSAGPPSAGQPRPAGEERRPMVAHLRHELRTALTAVIGYGEFLVESLEPGAPEEMESALRDLKGAGDAMLALVDSYLDASRVGALPGDALPRVMRDLSHACAAPVSAIVTGCPGLIALAERERMYGLIPILFKIQAAGVMLESLLRSYSLDDASLSAPLALAAPLASTKEARPALPRRDLPGRVLVVDDNSINRDLLRQWLERKGHTVDEAGGGEAALAMLRKSDYDVVLLDLRMPDLSGLEVLQALGAEGRLGKSPVIMLSASDEVDGVAWCLDHGADDYLLKPWNPVLLRTRIRLSMELKRLREREQERLSAGQKNKDA